MQQISIKGKQEKFIIFRDLKLILNIIKKNFILWEMMLIEVFSYFIALLLDWFLFCPRREIRLSSKELYIERPGGVGDLLLCYLALAIILVGLYYLFSKIFKKTKMKSNRIGTVCLGILVTLCIIFIFFIHVIPIAKVDNITPLAGRVTDPDSSYSYLFVRPFGSAQCWLQNPVPLQPDTDGEWRTLAYFGGITGSGYEIVLINSRTKLDKFSIPGDFDCNDIPRDVKRFVRVVFHK